MGRCWSREGQRLRPQPYSNTAYVSGSSIASNVGTYTQLICSALVSAAYVFIGQNTGAKNMLRIRRCMKISTLTVALTAIAINTVLNLISEPILAAFAPNNPEVVEFAKLKLLVNSSFYFLAHLEGLYSAAMRGMGNSVLPMTVSVVGICGVRILWIYTVFVWIRHPLTIFFAYAVSWGVTLIAQIFLYFKTRRKVAASWAQA